eukprot:4224212-Prymnesium_polylepis.1
MPNAGTKNAEVHVERLFPSARWLRAERVHREKAELRQFFVRVAPEQRADALRLALSRGPPGGALVFANSPDAAEEAHAALRATGTECALFHKNVAPAERGRALDAFRAGALRVL